MIGRRAARKILFYIAALLLMVYGAPLAAQQVQSEDNALRITGVDAAAFPSVTVRVLTTSTGGAPITDLTRLVLRENGVPIPDTTSAQTPTGVDLVLVIDANADLLLFDDGSGLSRRDKLVASITRYAEQFMDPAGLDSVSIIAPDETGANVTFLVQDATRPSDVSDAVNAYNPAAPPRVTPLQPMIEAAIDHLAAKEDGRFQAVLVYTDGARLHQQLDYPALVEAARTANIPLYAAILGADASAEETANVTALSSPANGLAIHTPEPEAADPIYAIFQAQGSQTEITYLSGVRENGTHEVSVSLGNVRDAAEFELFLAAPEVVIEAPESPVRRAGSAIDTPLQLLQPAVLPLTVRISWPDGLPRRLTETTFRVEGVAQPLAATLSPDASGQLPLPWDISDRDAGTYRLEVDVVDELGYRASAAPMTIAIEVTRPSPPTPTPVPTRVPLPSLSERVSGQTLPLLLLAVLAGLAALFFWRGRSRKKPATDETPIPRIVPATGSPADDRHVAVLEWPGRDGRPAEQIELTVADVTLGREPEAVDIIIDDPTISRLHARIRRTTGEEYWLYDEGSAQGTFLNYERLGLAPRQLQHNDAIQLGRVTLRFRLELPRQAGGEES